MSNYNTSRADLSKYVAEMLKGKERYLARLITLVESESEAVPDIMRLVFPNLGRAIKIGITGPPGAGKSTVIEKLTREARGKQREVGIICVDPTSPFTGGAILGDRIRMDRHYLDEGVYIRSMATRGRLGGIADATSNVAKLLDAYGKDLIFIETVGVGQTETDILSIADLIVVVLVPEAGDSIQAMKAGLLEIADIFLINKADRPGADNLANELMAALHSREDNSGFEKPVLTAQAAHDVGMVQLYEAIQRQRENMLRSGIFEGRRTEQRRKEFIKIVETMVRSRLLRSVDEDTALRDFVGNVEQGVSEPYTAAGELLKNGSLIKVFHRTA
ncbi:MAG: methylmalonyl Co-A mutase-associated GTPase MeaB [Dehalococcoidia bacterium]|nr:methylmalonyl Co-A mutase-associated GTPase MeaB [Dehalococcoidia bacterium]